MTRRAVAVPQIPGILDDHDALSFDVAACDSEAQIDDQPSDENVNECIPAKSTPIISTFSSAYSWVPSSIASLFTTSK